MNFAETSLVQLETSESSRGGIFHWNANNSNWGPGKGEWVPWPADRQTDRHEDGEHEHFILWRRRRHGQGGRSLPPNFLCWFSSLSSPPLSFLLLFPSFLFRFVVCNCGRLDTCVCACVCVFDVCVCNDDDIDLCSQFPCTVFQSATPHHPSLSSRIPHLPAFCCSFVAICWRTQKKNKMATEGRAMSWAINYGQKVTTHFTALQRVPRNQINGRAG